MINQLVIRLLCAKKYLSVSILYKNNVFNKSLMIKNDTCTLDLAFVSFMSDLINQQIESITVANCSNVLCNIQHNIISLTIINCKLQNISNLIASSLVYLDLGFNNLEDVTVLGNLINLKKLILRDNEIQKLDCLKLLVNIEHLDVQNNKLLFINFIKNLCSLSELFINGNCICDLNCVLEHPKCHSCITKLRDPTLDDVCNYFVCTKQQADSKFIDIQKLIKQRDAMPYYQYIIQMTKKYNNQIKKLTWIKILKQQVSSNQLDLIVDFVGDISNCEVDSSGKFWRIKCENKDCDIILAKMKLINPYIKTEINEFSILEIKDNNQIDNIYFVNQFNIEKVVIDKCENLTLYDVVDINILHVNNSKLKYIEGIQNWTRLLELNLQGNQLENISQLEHLINIRDLALHQNQIKNLAPLKGLVNLTDLQLDSNKIQNIDCLKGLTSLIELYLSQNMIQNIDILNELINLTALDVSSNQIQNIDSLAKLVNLKKLFLSQNLIQNIDSVQFLVNLNILDLSLNRIENVEPIQNLQNLIILWLPLNKIQNIYSLKWLVNLQQLDLRANYIRDLSPISNHSNFNNYYIRGQKVK
ncbi:leucine-rich_repeat domain-containing protein [Hexamita inflata]|uniref:Leucine-rich_repeat domain-containing protein n=1 Tax=Hexamita inflata TaxID=28002 RepID=A0ABP1L329_9EUKA